MTNLSAGGSKEGQTEQNRKQTNLIKSKQVEQNEKMERYGWKKLKDMLK